MKKLLFITAILFVVVSSAQNTSILNGGFENWGSAPYNEPANWYTLNELVDIGYTPSTTKTTDSRSGQFAVKLESRSEAFDNIPGILTTGPVSDIAGSRGYEKIRYPFTGRPEKLKFYYKTSPVATDTCYAAMILTAWNATSLKPDTVATAIFNQHATVSIYTLAEIPFNYLLPSIPDSASIIFSSSKDLTYPKTGSSFIVDDLSLVYANSGMEDLYRNKVLIYPNPAADFIDIVTENTCKLVITDFTGREVLIIPVISNKNQVNITSFTPGIYFFQLFEKNEIIEAVKVNIIH